MVWPWVFFGAAALAVNAARGYWWPEKAGAKPPSGATVHPCFEAFADAVVAPRIGTCEDDAWVDPSASDYGGKPVHWFERDNRIWGVNADTRFGPLIAAHHWIKAHPGDDPFRQVRTSGKGQRHTLILKPELKWSGPKHLYIYS